MEMLFWHVKRLELRWHKKYVYEETGICQPVFSFWRNIMKVKGYCESEQYSQEDGSRRFHAASEEGEMEMTRYQVFPGISLIYNDVHMARNLFDVSFEKGNMFEIDHCREGRMECQVGKEYFYLAQGDISIHRLGEMVREEVFPTNHYHGITIQVDLEKCPKCLGCFLDDVDVEPAAIAEKFRLDENLYFALRQLPSIEHIFSELYSVPKTVKKGYLKVKVLELFLFLSGLEPEKERMEQRRFSEKQVKLAKRVNDFLMEHLEEHITVTQLSDQFGVSASTIKNSFSGVYGTSIHTYMRGQRMQAAAKLLKETDRTVLDIAGEFGYENGSKFADAFRSVMGVTPTRYRSGICRMEE